jgi:uncharacterized protein YbjT (DUF2867 family)
MPCNVVFGAGGPTGLECVKRLLEVTNLPVRAVVRKPDAHADKLKAAAGNKATRLEVVAGDVTDPASLPPTLTDASGVIFAASGKGYWSAKSVDEQGVKNVVDAAAAAGGVQRVVLVSSMLTHPSNRFNPIRILLNNIRWGLMDHKYAGEEALRNSSLSWTVVRPAGLSSGPAGQAVLKADVDKTRENMSGGGSISRADVAAVCVESLVNPAAANKTLSVYATREKLADGQTVSDEVTRLFGMI